MPRLSDHDIVLVKVNSCPEIIKQIPRDIPLYKKANWDQLKQSMRDLYTEFQSEPATTDSQAMWDKFTSRLQQGIDKHIPTRSSGTKDGFPWINQEIRRLMRKRDKLYRRWSRSGRPDDQKKFRDQKHLVRRIIDRAYEKYLKDILGLNDEEHDLESPPKVKTKKLYSLLKHSKQNPSGILVLKANAKVAHEKLLLKLHFYGIRGNILNWMKDFLDNRTQSVILNVTNSDNIAVSSGVPQGSVLGPILFLAYINDLPEQVRSRVRLFADDTAMYLALDKQADSEILQKDLEILENWESSGT